MHLSAVENLYIVLTCDNLKHNVQHDGYEKCEDFFFFFIYQKGSQAIGVNYRHCKLWKL